MRTKLLKKLRKKYSSKYYISRSYNAWKVYNKKTDYYAERTTLEQAKKYVKLRASEDINNYIRERRIESGRSRIINYYPW